MSEQVRRKLKAALQENARLQAEVEAYRSASDEVAAAFLALPAPHNQVARVCEGIESLKAEVERLTEIIRREVDGGVDLREEAQRTVDENHKLRAELASLRASSFVTAVPIEQYERLRKAGDAIVDEGEVMARDVSFVVCVWDNRVADWNAAKEGEQS